ncbi:MAG: hypothetical protein LW693_05035 [Saprospiraceae bacterium]|nr:hypothetical protein [Saprospiraceae bacterium]
MYPIGVFDSGYGGLTVFREIRKRLPEYDYIYLGDNGRAPYGPRDFDTIYQYTLESVKYLFGMGKRLAASPVPVMLAFWQQPALSIPVHIYWR